MALSAGDRSEERSDGRPVSAARDEPLLRLLGGGRAAAEATLAPLAFGAGWLLAGRSVGAGVLAAVVTAAVVAGWRMRRGHRSLAVLGGLLAVCLAAMIALRTGRAADFFVIQIVSNVASAVLWILSIAVRWPLLGIVVGVVLGQRTRWRRDPALLRAYGRGSWVWVGQYVLRVSVLLPLYQADRVVELTVARVALTWPLLVACLVASWAVVRRALPPGHPGLRHPVHTDR